MINAKGSGLMFSKLLKDIYSELDINADNGLVNDEYSAKTPYQYYFFNHVKEKMKVDSIYFLRIPGGEARIPLIYFTAMDTYDTEKIAELHKIAWNLGEAPLLFVVLPDQLLVYNNFQHPRYIDGKLDHGIGLIEKIKIVKGLEIERQKLIKYHRSNLETGEYWLDKSNKSNRFDIKNRVDSTLINNLTIMRTKLFEKIKNAKVVHNLLGRAILIKYLEDRKDNEGNRVFCESFYNQFLAEANSFLDILDNKEATYNLFLFLQEKFNGDLFPVTSEEFNLIEPEDLNYLKHFLSGEIDIENGQLSLFPLYTFDAIPIQLISSIYEMFFHMEVSKGENKGTYYTPYHLVELLMDEILPWEGQYEQIKIFDPACGSGIFLVEAYRRLIGRWIFGIQKPIEINELINILKGCIFGVDRNEEAVRIASFSLYLTLCDYLDSATIWDELRFPAMRGSNLFVSDFFDNKAGFNQHKFDIIVGNPPWESELSSLAALYVKETGMPVGDKQIAQAFSWKVAELSHEKTNICLLMPSKGFLFNISSRNLEFRKKFFTEFSVSTIINFSVFRKVLFEHASGPATAVFYRICKPNFNEPIIYCSPKPTHSIEDRRRFTIEPNNISRIPRDRCLEKHIWKVGMWGGPRDLELLNKISRYPSFEEYAKKTKLKYGEGFIVGNKKYKFDGFLGKPEVDTRRVPRYSMNINECTLCKKSWFYRYSKKNMEIYKAPHLLVKQAPRQRKGFYATYLDFDAVFTQSFVGIHGDEKILKYLSLLINSKLFTYFSLMTSSRWLIERDEIEVNVLENFPIPDINLDMNFNNKIDSLFEYASKTPENGQNRIEQFVAELYELTVNEVNMIDDAINLTYDEFLKGIASPAKFKPNSEDLSLYSNTLKRALSSSFDTPMQVICLQGNSPLIIAEITCLDKKSINSINDNAVADLNKQLCELDQILFERKSQGVYVRRNVRIYERDKIYIVKPNQKKYWSFSAAYRDADDIFAEIMRAWRKSQ